MSIETEKALLYKELAEISEKITPLRNEYNFIVTDIPDKRKEHDNLTKNIWDLRAEIQETKEQLEQYRKWEKAKIDSDIMALSSKKKQEIATLDNRYIELQGNIELLQGAIEKEGRLLADIRQEYDKKKMLIDDIKIQEREAKNNIEEYNKKHNQLLLDDKQRASILDSKEKELNLKEKQLNDNEKKYIKIKWDAEGKIKVMETMMFELTQREEKSLKMQADIERRETQIREKQEHLDKTHIEAKEMMQMITEKELKINKNISDFQDEKYKFLVLMKQKEIKRTDIDKLDKEFNL